jgi:hypothetical protein
MSLSAYENYVPAGEASVGSAFSPRTDQRMS